MNNNDMHQPPSRCSSTSSIPNKHSRMSNGHHQPLYHGKYPFEYQSNRTSFYRAAASPPRKEATNSIFSFLQRFRAKNRSIFEDANSLPSSPRSSRVSSRATHRWESVESVLSSATATSFAFIPPYRHHPNARFSHKASKAPPPPRNLLATPANSNTRSARENCAFLRKKYNLHGSDITLYHNKKDTRADPVRASVAGAKGVAAATGPVLATTCTKSLKKLQRNSVADVENLAARCWLDNDYSSLNRIRPYSDGCDTLQIRRSHCYRPGKRRAPQPPTTPLPSGVTVHRRPSGARKKRKAPSPPKGATMSADEEQVHTGGAMYNDSLKLERGVLKANKQSVASSAATETSGVPVSPKPWYKRSATQPNLKSTGKGADKKKSCEQLLDEWMLEAGLPRSTSFYERKLVNELNPSAGASSGDAAAGNPKRRSQISMLANISELDREAAEIVQQERKREKQVAHSMDDKFYAMATAAAGSVTLADESPPATVTISDNDAASSRKRTTPKDLLSLLNAITNVTRITVNSATFFKETLVKSSSSSAVAGACSGDIKSVRAAKSPDRRMRDRLTITELEDFDEDVRHCPVTTSAAAAAVISQTRRRPQTAAAAAAITKIDGEPLPDSRSSEALKPVPVKPFSNWMCPQCTLENPSWKFICEACRKWRPYSVNRLNAAATPKIVPKEDAKLKVDEKSDSILVRTNKFNRSNVSENVRQEIKDTLASVAAASSEKNASAKPIDKNVFQLPQPTATKLEEFSSDLNYRESSNDNTEEVRKARLAFFARNRLNDLNGGEAGADNDEKIKPRNVETKQKCYSEEDRQKLREILKELKDSLPKSDLFADKSSKRKVTVHSTGFNESHLPMKKISITEIGNRDFKSKEKAEAYLITKRTVVENLSSTSKTVATDENSNEKIELRVPVVEREIQENGKIRTKIDKEAEEVIRVDLKNIQPIKNEVLLNRSNGSSLLETSSKVWKHELQDDGNLTTDCKATSTAKENKNLTSVTVNRLLKKLQTAIASGQHHEAANIARDLARLKVNCNMTRQDTPDVQRPAPEQIQNISVDIHVQENNLPRDPIRLKISPRTTINELQTKISAEHGIPVTSQQLIFGKHPITDVSATLDQIGVNSNGMIMFLKVLKFENGVEHETEPIALEHRNNLPSYSRQHFSELFEKVVKQPSEEISQTVIKSELTISSTSEEKKVPADESPKSKMSKVNVLASSPKNLESSDVASLQINCEKSSNVSDWVCSACTLINEENAKACIVCGRVKHQDVASFSTTDKEKPTNSSETKKEIAVLNPANYLELMELEKTDLIANVKAFDCAVCLVAYDVGEGVVLKDCLHIFCRECLSQTIEHCVEAEVKCPYRDADYSCESVLQEREIKALVTAEAFEKHLARSVAEAENKIKNAFHCKTANCRGWCIFEDNVNEFHCPVCSKTNCLTCQVIHSGLNCKQYQEVINKESETNADANRTRLMLQEMLQKGEAMTCPTCEVIVMKKWGCDWLRCSMCKTEICWVTRGPRWGPKGKGDTTGGCRCGVNGVKCHQRCTFCH